MEVGVTAAASTDVLDGIKIFPSSKISAHETKNMLRSARRGSTLRRDALHRMRREHTNAITTNPQQQLISTGADPISEHQNEVSQSHEKGSGHANGRLHGAKGELS